MYSGSKTSDLLNELWRINTGNMEDSITQARHQCSLGGFVFGIYPGTFDNWLNRFCENCDAFFIMI